MYLVDKPISVQDLKPMSEKMFSNLVKAVVDVEKQIMVIDADMHADQEYFLLENDSEQKNLWGINLYPFKHGGPDWIEFDSMINLRPSQGNRSRGVDDAKLRDLIISIVNKLIN